MADRYFPNTLSDYVVSLQNSVEDSQVQAEAGDVMLKAVIALRDEVNFHLERQVSNSKFFAFVALMIGSLLPIAF